MDKNDIDRQAEREALALRKQGRCVRPDGHRIRQADNYNKDKFERLFKRS